MNMQISATENCIQYLCSRAQVKEKKYFCRVHIRIIHTNKYLKYEYLMEVVFPKYLKLENIYIYSDNLFRLTELIKK